MEQNYSRARLSRDPAARALVEYFVAEQETLKIVDGSIYYEYPPFRDEKDTFYRSTVLLASRSHGLMLFKALSGDRNLTDPVLKAAEADIEQIDSLLFGKLLKSPVLRKTPREVAVPINSYIFLHDAGDPFGKHRPKRLLQSFHGIKEAANEVRVIDPIPLAHWEETLSIVEGAKGLLRPKDRAIPPAMEGSKAGILAQLEAEVAVFDRRQRRAAITLLDGPQRIRGLAGSGKTVILAMKAAQLHLADPSLSILFTFYTKSLYEFIKSLITRFYRHFSDQDPDFENKVHIRHAWGGKEIGGVYYDAAIEAGAQPINLNNARGKASEPFDYVCSEVLKSGRVHPRYDYVLMDEAQDFPASFYRLCFELTRGGSVDRNIVWAYDELQNIMNVRLRSTRETFGTHPDGTAVIDLDRIEKQTGDTHDTILHKCYRNPREVLVVAHALGFGIYGDAIVQMLENKDHWEDVGYNVVKGNCLPGEETVIERPSANSPLTISTLEDRDQLIRHHVAADLQGEMEWVCAEIQHFLKQGLRPDDVLVITLDDQSARTYFQMLTNLLRECEVMVNNLLLDPYSVPSFSRENLVTLSTVWRAKGNEAALVFAIGIDAIAPYRNTKQGRNKLFTAMTRAKAWLRISGVGKGALRLTRELDAGLELVPRMEFVYPDLTELELVQRDLSDQAGKIGRARRELEEHMEQLDLSDDDRLALLEMILKKRE